MSQFVKYQSLERLGTTEVSDIEEGHYFIFPKIDGTNAGAWSCENGLIHAGSRNRNLDLENDNAGFMATILNDEKLKSFFAAHADKQLYGANTTDEPCLWLMRSILPGVPICRSLSS